MSRDDEAGAVAAATYFLTLYSYTQSTQDTSAWVDVSHPDCRFCASVVEDVTDQRAKGRVTRAAPIEVHSASTEEISPLAFSVTLEVTTGPDDVYGADGELMERTTNARGRTTVWVVRQGAVWVVRGVTLDQAT